MKRSLPVAGISVLTLLTLLFIGAGGPVAAEPAQEPAESEPAPRPAGGVDAEAAQAVLETACTSCHPLADYGIAPGQRTTAEWQEVINRMVSYGATVSDENYQLLLDYLATDAGGVDAEAAQALLNTACTTCHPLGDYGIEPGLYTSAEWLVTIDRMISYGATLSDEQKQLLLDYLGTD